MSTLTETELVDVLVGWVRRNNLNNGSSNVTITGETNLFESGLLDSLGFVELIVFMENQWGCKLDLSDVAPEEFTLIKSLCQMVLKDSAKV